MENVIDIFVIGGGINGAAIAADAAGRGLSVTLCEKNDLASGTSSASTKLIHGGLRYLEFFEFNLVRNALKERKILMNRAPNLITPLQFVLPHESHLRSAFLIRLGLFLYDHLSPRTNFSNSESVNFQFDPRGEALLSKFKKGFAYYDCFTDDARLVVLNALSAKKNGATILTRTEFISAIREKDEWKISLKNKKSGIEIYYAKVLINAAGPWIHQVQKNIDSQLTFEINLVKGSHIIVPKLYEGDFAYILQNQDDRVIFAIPYQNNFTLIGTTDVPYTDDMEHVRIDETEKNYLCDIMNNYFKKKITPDDIVWSYAGVRCLQKAFTNNVSKITRDYKLLLEEKTAPLLTVIGGKMTTHRTLAEDVLSKLQKFFPTMGPAWTAKKPLPGCDFPNNNFDTFYQKFRADFSWLPDTLAFHYSKNYGTNAYLLLKNANDFPDLGEEFSSDLYQKEVEYLIQYEWAETIEDILWRRTKFGLFLSEDEIKKLEHWMKAG